MKRGLLLTILTITSMCLINSPIRGDTHVSEVTSEGRVGFTKVDPPAPVPVDPTDPPSKVPAENLVPAKKVPTNNGSDTDSVNGSSFNSKEALYCKLMNNQMEFTSVW